LVPHTIITAAAFFKKALRWEHCRSQITRKTPAAALI
jgi:hypothetical protein